MKSSFGRIRQQPQHVHQLTVTASQLTVVNDIDCTVALVVCTCGLRCAQVFQGQWTLAELSRTESPLTEPERIGAR